MSSFEDQLHAEVKETTQFLITAHAKIAYGTLPVQIIGCFHSPPARQV